MTNGPKWITALAMLIAAVALLVLAFDLTSPTSSETSGDTSSDSIPSDTSMPATAGASPSASSPTNSPSLDTRLQTIQAAVVPTATADLPPRATVAPKPTCPVYGTATREGRCYTYPPTPTPAPTRPPKVEPTTAPCLPTPVPEMWCAYGPGTPPSKDT
jgi:hypothetical protein